MDWTGVQSVWLNEVNRTTCNVWNDMIRFDLFGEIGRKAKPVELHQRQGLTDIYKVLYWTIAPRHITETTTTVVNLSVLLSRLDLVNIFTIVGIHDSYLAKTGSRHSFASWHKVCLLQVIRCNISCQNTAPRMEIRLKFG